MDTLFPLTYIFSYSRSKTCSTLVFPSFEANQSFGILLALSLIGISELLICDD
ncbi:hypothetical protein AM1_E0166 (plasmid) [Acaryochloris marina MBIC11017]|uniref:Uncharacterized protein n=1 Tax=Acaryochloris marina (strain MBIC 11017) TaxID=329726 RepID=A8ZPJ9_ACAM1|nr:hypothetical protein AM1_E0166 [Acaryochloris marina MBIC11017]